MLGIGEWPPNRRVVDDVADRRFERLGTFVGDFGVLGGQVARDGFGDVAEGIELLRGEQVGEAVTNCKQMVGSCHFDGSTAGLGKDDVETTPVTGARRSLNRPSGLHPGDLVGESAA